MYCVHHVVASEYIPWKNADAHFGSVHGRDFQMQRNNGKKKLGFFLTSRGVSIQAVARYQKYFFFRNMRLHGWTVDAAIFFLV